MRCVAVGCKTSRKSGLRIHSFPRDPKRRLEWAVKVNLAENGKLWVPPKESTCYGVCEVHFEEDQYEPRRKDRKLKASAVPTLFEHRRAPRKRRKLKRVTPPPAPAKEPEPEPEPMKDTQQLTAAFIAASNDHTYLAPRGQPQSSAQDQGPPRPQSPSAMVAFTVPTFLPPSSMVFTTRGHSLLRSLIPTTTVRANSAGGTTASTASPVLLVSTGRTMSTSSPLSVTTTTNSARTAVPNNVILQALPTPTANPQGIRPLVSIAPVGGAIRISGPITVQAASSSGTNSTFSSTTPITAQNLGTFTTTAPITPQNIVLPPFNCPPGGGPIILVPVNNMSQRAPGTVSVPVSGDQLPVILSVESLQRYTGHTPILKKPPTYEELRIEAAKLQSQAAAHCQEISKYNAQLVKVKTSLAKQTEQLGKFLNMDQVECVQRLPGEKVKWTDKTLKFALEVYSCSPTVYRKLLDSHYPLPPELALKKYCADNGVRDGVPAELYGLEEVVPEDEEANIVWL